MFELTLHALAAKGTLDPDSKLQSFEELWDVLATFPDQLLDQVVPGVHKASWILNPSGLPSHTELSSHLRSVAPRKALDGKDTMGATFYEGDSADAEAFRRSVTRSFRHAVRGEWDAVAVLGTVPNEDADDDFNDPGPELPPWEEPAFGEAGWSEKHSRTLQNWCSLGSYDKETAPVVVRKKAAGTFMGMFPRGMQKSHSDSSLPKLHSTHHGSFNGQRNSSSFSRDGTGHSSMTNFLPRVHGSRNQPDVVDMRFGEDALRRFDHFSSAKAASSYRMVRVIEPMSYNCPLCGNKHELQVQCDPFG